MYPSAPTLSPSERCVRRLGVRDTTGDCTAVLVGELSPDSGRGQVDDDRLEDEVDCGNGCMSRNVMVKINNRGI